MNIQTLYPRLCLGLTEPALQAVRLAFENASVPNTGVQAAIQRNPLLALRAGMKTDSLPPIEVSRRMRLGAPKAITATAHKLARILYNLMRYGVEYMQKTEAEYAEQEHARQEKSFHRRAKELGYEVHRPPTTDAEPMPA